MSDEHLINWLTNEQCAAVHKLIDDANNLGMGLNYQTLAAIGIIYEPSEKKFYNRIDGKNLFNSLIYDNLNKKINNNENIKNSIERCISYPKLNLLSPTIESTLIKLMEECGEIARLVGKYRSMSGEVLSNPLTEKELLYEIASELFDAAQVCTTFLYTMEEREGINLDDIHDNHIKKLRKKGYMS